MANKIIEGLWDCPYCGEKGISGLTKSCPNCAHPQDAGTKFYLSDEKKEVSEDKAGNYGKGADWTCAYCGSLNHYDQPNCLNCGAERADSSGDYFENRKKQEEEAQKPVVDPTQAPPPPPKRSRKGLLIIGAIIAALIIFGIVRAIPKDRGVTVSDPFWERSVLYESYQIVTEQDWRLPDGAELLSSSREIRDYEKVFDHYEDEEYQVSEEVLDGYDTVTDYVDNGDGTFSEVVSEVPRYRTEYHTETRQVKIYRNEPVYDTLYTYNIGRWLTEEPETVRGSCWQPTDMVSRSGYRDVSEPQWPVSRASDTVRELDRGEAYYLLLSDSKGNTYTVRLSESAWQSYQQGQSVSIKANAAGAVTEFDGNPYY